MDKPVHNMGIVKTFLGFFIFVAFFLTISAKNSAASEQFLLSRTLKIGSVGEDVRQLQKILNSDSETAVSVSGIGSAGQESTYFGQKTRLAVIKFQEKHANLVLFPLGLSKGTGVVGSATQQTLSGIFSQNLAVKNQIVAEIPKPQTNVASIPRQTIDIGESRSSPENVSLIKKLVPDLASSTNPNLTNLGKFLTDIDMVARQKSISDSEITKVKEHIVNDVKSTSRNYKEEFLEIAKKNSVAKTDKSKGYFSTFLGSIAKSLKIEVVSAQSTDGTTPFGGAVYYYLFCSCTGNWILDIQPLEPSYAAILTYMNGTQIYLTYNIPFTANLVGRYQSGGRCQIYAGTGCVSLPNQGDITSTVGSAPLP